MRGPAACPGLARRPLRPLAPVAPLLRLARALQPARPHTRAKHPPVGPHARRARGCRCQATAALDGLLEPRPQRGNGLLRRAQLALLDAFPPLGSPEVLRRAAVTLGLICLLRLGAFVPLAGVDQAAAARSAATLAALEAGGGAVPSLPVTVFSLGIGPMFAGGMVVSVSRLLPPQLLPWTRRSGEEGQMDDKLTEKGVAAVAALLVGLVRALQLRTHCAPAAARGFVPQAALTLAGGAVVLHFLADTNEAAGLGMGAGLLVAVSLLQRQAQLVSLALQRLRAGAVAPAQAAAAAAAAALLVAAAIWASLVERRLEMVSTKIGAAAAQPGRRVRRRRGSSGSGGGSSGSSLPIRITPTGVSSLMLSSVYLGMGLQLLPTLFGAKGAAAAAALAGPLAMPALVAGVSFASVFVNPAGAKMTQDLSVMLQNIGAGIRAEPPVPPGAPTKRLLARQLRAANFWGGLAVAALGCGAHGADLLCQAALGVTFGAVNLLLLTGFVTSTYRQVAALSELPKLGRRIQREQQLLQGRTD